MTRLKSTDKILWMADCYSLAKHFHDPITWLALLQSKNQSSKKDINPFNYWLWMEIWKAAQSERPLAVK